MGISSSGLISGLKTDELISQLMAVERRPEEILKKRETTYQTKVAAILELKTKLATFSSALQSLSSATKFNTRNASVTSTTDGEELLTVSASSTAALGTYALEVHQIAKTNIKASQGWEDQGTTPIASATGRFRFRLGSGGSLTTVSVNENTTLQGLRNAINAAGGGVTASIINDGSGANPYRLVLTGTSTGSANGIIITENDTDLDFTNKKIETAYAYTSNTYSGNVYANSGNYYTGTDNKTFLVKVTTAGATSGALADRAKYKYSTDGGITWSSEITAGTGGADTTADIVIDSTNKTLYRNGAAVTLTEGTYTGSGLATELQTQLGAGYAVSYDGATRKFTITNSTGGSVVFNWSNAGSTAAGVLGYDTSDSTVANAGTDVSDYDAGLFIDAGKVANSTNGRVKISFGTTGTLALDDKFSVDVFNPEMQAAQDAVIKVGNSTMTKSSNTVTDAIEGVTLNLLKADASSSLTLTVSRESSDAKESINEFVEAYNTIMEFLNKQLSYDTETKKANPLLGDATVMEIRNKIGRIVTGSIPGLGTSSYTNLSQIGITSNSKTGKLSVDSSKVAAALVADPDAVARLFIGTATPSNEAVSFVSKTKNTETGTYSVHITTAPEKATLLGGQTIASGGISADETLTFLYSNDKSESIPSYTGFSVALSAGATVNSIVNSLNSAFATEEVALTASNEGGKVQITSTNYGADQYFKVTSDKGDIAGQVGFNSDGTSEDTGVDVVGTINSHATTGTGNQLTSKSGFAEDGLTITVESSETGGLGTITISSGIADKLPASLATYTDVSSGILKSKESSIQKSIDDIESQIQRMEDRFAKEEETLRERFTRLETLLAQYNSVSQYLTVQLAAFSNSKAS